MLKVLQITFSSLLITFTLISLSKADLIKPRSDIKPAEVIKIQLNGLQKNDDNYKVFVEVAFKKKELFKSLDKINID